MQVIAKGTMPDGTAIQIEEWHENYDFIPYASTLGTYPKSKMSHEGAFAPKGNQPYRFQFNFQSSEEVRGVFDRLVNGEAVLADYKSQLNTPKYKDCL